MEKFIRTKTSVNLRSGSSTSFSIIKTLSVNTVVEILEDAEGTWYKCMLQDGTIGYITSLSQYVEDYIPQWLIDARRVIDYGKTFLGKPYVYGSTRYNEISFDCSDFTQYVFDKTLGIKLDSNSRLQADDAPEVSLSDIRTGDIVFFQKNDSIYHVSIYVHDDKLLHTYNDTCIIYNEDLQSTGETGGVTFTRFSGYWKDRAGLCKVIRPIK